MSDTTMSTAASSPALSAQQSSADGLQQDFASDTQLVMAAIARMEAAVRGERATHERLRAELESMAEAIAHVKISVRNAASSGKPVNVLVLLTWLEARVQGMRGYLGQPPAAAPLQEAVTEPSAAEAIQPDRAELPAAADEVVPTVSDVVSRLGRASEALEKEAHALEQTAAADDVPTVSMLGAMVEALTAPESVAAEAKAETEAPAQTVEPAVAEQTQAEPEAAVLEVSPEAEMAAAETNVAETATPDAVADDPAPEVTAFAEELGTPEPVVLEPAAIEAHESELTRPEALVVETVVANESTAEASAPEPASIQTDPVSDVAALVSEPEEAETATDLTPPEPVAPEAIGEETTATEPTEATAIETVAIEETTAAATPAHEPNAHEFELLTRFAAMEAIPFMRDEIGTAVIFEPKAEFDPAAEQMAFETPAKPVEAVAEPVEMAVQAGSIAEESQPKAASHADQEIETAENAAIEPEPVTHGGTNVETVSQAQPDMIAAPGQHVIYTGVSSLVSLGAMGATAALIDATKPKTGTVEIAKIEFFDVDEAEAEAVTAADVIAECALDAIVVEPAPVGMGELTAVTESAEASTTEAAAIATPEPEASAPAATSAAIETISAAAIGVTAAIETVEPEATAEISEIAQAQAETATIEIAETVIVAETASTEAEMEIAGPTEAERVAFARALAEMAVSSALEPEMASASATEAQAEPAPPGSAEAEPAAVTTVTLPAETSDAADDDLSDLFEPEPDAALDPNAVLLGPTPAPPFTLDPATAAVLPMHDMALPPEAPKAASPQMKLVEAAEAPAPAKRHDPLAPLKAMSDEEKIALFS